jgi:hypothetical protein
MRYMLVTLLFATGCTAHLVSTTRTNLVNAAHLTEASYHYLDAGSAPAALERGAFCSINAVLRDEKLGPLDSGIVCAP